MPMPQDQMLDPNSLSSFPLGIGGAPTVGQVNESSEINIDLNLKEADAQSSTLIQLKNMMDKNDGGNQIQLSLNAIPIQDGNEADKDSNVIKINMLEKTNDDHYANIAVSESDNGMPEFGREANRDVETPRLERNLTKSDRNFDARSYSAMRTEDQHMEVDEDEAMDQDDDYQKDESQEDDNGDRQADEDESYQVGQEEEYKSERRYGEAAQQYQRVTFEEWHEHVVQDEHHDEDSGGEPEIVEEVDDFMDYAFPDELWKQKCWDILYIQYFDYDAQAFLMPLTRETLGEDFDDYMEVIRHPINFIMIK